MEMNELISKHLELVKGMKKLEDEDKIIKEYIKNQLNIRNVDRFEDDNHNLVTFRQQTRESIDKDKVKSLLGEIQFQQVVKVTTFDVLKITTKDQRDRIKDVLR